MKINSINTLIDNYTKNINKEFMSNSTILSAVFNILLSIYGIHLKLYVAVVCILIILIAEVICLFIVNHKKCITIYSGILFSMMFWGNFAAFFNFLLYCEIRDRDLGLFISVVIVEILCLVTGFLYTQRCIKKDKVQSKTAVAFAPLAYLSPVLFVRGLSSYIRNNTSESTQTIFYTIVFSFGSCLFMFVLGMIHISVLYYIKKYNISNREIPGSWNDED